LGIGEFLRAFFSLTIPFSQPFIPHSLYPVFPFYFAHCVAISVLLAYNVTVLFRRLLHTQRNKRKRKFEKRRREETAIYER